MRRAGLARIGLALLLVALAGRATTADAPVGGPVEEEAFELCLLRAARTAAPERTLAEVHRWCELDLTDQQQINEHALRARLALEELVQQNPFILTPHRRNYLMFWSYWDDPHWGEPSPEREDLLENHEATFQLSFKVPILTDLPGGLSFYGAFTLTAFWQVYSGDLSRPFREINYEPELFASRRLSGRLGPVRSELLSFGYWHASNGRDIPASRSWDRLFVNYVFTVDDWYVSLRPWWRIPERRASDDPDDPRRDDNPDIERYLGHFELTLARPMGSHVTELLFRNNLRRGENRGAAGLSYTFPLNRRFKGIVQAFTGYGDSLISYDEYQNRFSLGILLTDHF